MSIERIYYCDAPDCEGPVHARTAAAPSHLPSSFIEVRSDREGVHSIEGTAHFCCWDCLMRFAAARPEDIRLDLDPPTERESDEA